MDHTLLAYWLTAAIAIAAAAAAAAAAASAVLNPMYYVFNYVSRGAILLR